ncbi:MAG: PKD domain-containing protein [Candidatus Acetothermia bacterium]|nr:PKD domain-containing protein [Candidatus Acetothermia bacterium]
MRKLACTILILTSLALFGCLNPSTGPRAVIATTPNPPRGEYPLTVTFDGTRSTGEIDQYLWDFGDDTTADGPVVSHTYTTMAQYTAYLTVVSPTGRTHQGSVTVDVRSKRPVARFTMYPFPYVQAEQTITFDASDSYDPDGTIVEYIWNFGDGSWTSTNGPQTTHDYDEAGTYTVTLVVKDDHGDVSLPAEKGITVTGKCCGG